MREAAAPVYPAARSIAQLLCSADMALPFIFPVSVPGPGKARVNRRSACTGKRRPKSSTGIQ